MWCVVEQVFWFLSDVVLCHWVSILDPVQFVMFWARILVLVGCDIMSLGEYFGSCAMWYVIEQVFWFLWDVMPCRVSILGPVRCDMSSKNFGSCEMWCRVEWVCWVSWDVTFCHWVSSFGPLGCDPVSLNEYFGSCRMWDCVIEWAVCNVLQDYGAFNFRNQAFLPGLLDR